jgi:phosphatidylserine/phosphatidylglycerophosphate/cardiolipin synthase-like enzyme
MKIILDQTHPLNFSQMKRNCHIKFMSIDDQVAIMGNGNMDSQSWYHSQVNQQKFSSKKYSSV